MNENSFEKIIESFEDSILILEENLLEYSNKENCNKKYVFSQKKIIESLKEYFFESQKVILQQRSSAPITNFINHSVNYINDCNADILRENQNLKKLLENYKTIFDFHCIKVEDIDFLNKTRQSKETKRQASLNKARAEMPNLY
jgi:hypothetical protein